MITKNIIGFELSAHGPADLLAVDQVSGQPFPEKFHAATASEVDAAMEKAHAAWKVFRQMPGKRRASFLSAIAEGIERLGDTLISRIMAETAYPESRVRVERTRTCAQLRMWADIIRDDAWRELSVTEALPERTPAPRPELRRSLIAIGPVVVFGASNFPLAYSTAGGDTASALAAGCPVVVKAHEAHLGTHALVAEVILEAARQTEMPDGVFSSLFGQGMDTGRRLVGHPLTAAVGFTGSQSGGRALFDLGAGRKHPIPVFAEMGSVNPVFLLPHRLQEAEAQLIGQLAGSMTMSGGQFCTQPGILVLLASDASDTFIDRLAEALEAVGETQLLHPGIAESYHRGVSRVTEIDGVRRMTTADPGSGKAAPVLARVGDELFLRNPELHHEIFGPYSLIVECSSAEKMQEVASRLEGQLTATIQAAREDKPLACALQEILLEKAGRIVFNGVPTGVEVCDAMTHGGPYPASTDSRYTAVGRYAIHRWVRPVTFQQWPEEWLPDYVRG